MSIRVIAGTAKGRQLKLVPGEGTRPIMDRVKESLFNIIGRDIYDAAFLDLFAGTGSVAIEALSRGAAYALLLDNDKRAYQTILENLKLTGLSANAEARRADAFALLAAPPPRTFDFIYIAPPQYKGMWADALTRLDANLAQRQAWLTEDGTAIAQIDPTEYEPVTLSQLELTDQRQYGSTLLCFYQPREDTHTAEGNQSG